MSVEAQWSSTSAGTYFRRIKVTEGVNRVLETVRLVLLVLVLGALMFYPVELKLLDHSGSWQAAIPYWMSPIGFVATFWYIINPGPISRKIFNAVMGLLLLTGLAGIAFHFTFNLEGEPFEWEFLMDVLEGARPLLAPFAFAQIGIMGLLATFGKH